MGGAVIQTKKGFVNPLPFPQKTLTPTGQLITIPPNGSVDYTQADRDQLNWLGAQTSGGLADNLIKFEGSRLSDTLQSYAADPERALLGINTPLESSVWGTVLNKDYDSTSNMLGGPTSDNYQSAESKGIDTDASHVAHDVVAPMLLSVFGGGALANGLSAGAVEGGTVGLDASTGLFAGETSAGVGTSGALGGTGGAALSGEMASGGSSSGGNGMWDWLDDIGTDPVNFEGGSGDFFNDPSAGTDLGYDPSSNTFPGESTTSGPAGSNATDPGILDQLKQAYDQGKLGKTAYDAINKLLGGGGGTTGKPSTGGGILDNVLNDPLGAAFNATPFLLALSEANKQGGDLNGVLNSINQDAYRKSVLDPYDLETGQGRALMQQDQGLRGVAGSSFGDQSLNNYDYTRNLGRSDMASKANLAAAGLQGQLINQRNTNRNLLLGAGLNASGKLFSTQKDPFDLNKLLGLS